MSDLPNPVDRDDGPADPIPGELLGRGRTADVHRWTKGTVVKIFHPDRPGESIDLEERTTRAVASMSHSGFAVPAFHGRVAVADGTNGGRVGLVLDEVVGDEMLDQLGSRPWKMASLARSLAEVHAAIGADRSATDLADLPSLVERMQRRCGEAADLLGPLAASVDERLRELVEEAGSQPEVLCHGDFHPGNVLLTERRPMVIDWTNAARGPVGMDVAMTTVLLTCAEVPGSGVMRAVMVAARSAFHSLHRRASTRLRPEAVAQADRWLPVMAAARLMDSPTSEHPALLSIVRSRLS